MFGLGLRRLCSRSVPGTYSEPMNLVTVHCPSCGSTEPVQVAVRLTTTTDTGFDVDFKLAHVEHVCPDSTADSILPHTDPQV